MKSTILRVFLFFCLAATGMIDPGTAAATAAPAQEAARASTTARQHSTALWQKAFGEYERGRTSKDVRQRSAHLRQAEQYAQQAIKADPHDDEGYKWLAITLGAQAEDASVKTQIRLSRLVKENIEKALTLDPADDISLLVLSRWHYKVASLQPWTRAFVRLVYGGLPAASMEKSENLLLRAIAIKDRIAHRYSLAKVYHQMGRKEAALKQLRLALALPVTFAEEADDREKARRKLSSWK
jgi:tetratricopeptide (TPR) repeat protein